MTINSKKTSIKIQEDFKHRSRLRLLQSWHSFLQYNKQLNNTLQVIDYREKQNKELEKIIQELQPRWYDNKLFWFLSGVSTVVCVVLAIQ